MAEIQNKYIRSDIGEVAYGKPVYSITSRKRQTSLGMVGWYPNWKRYVFFANENTVWDSGCLKSLTDFLDTLNPKEVK